MKQLFSVKTLALTIFTASMFWSPASAQNAATIQTPPTDPNWRIGTLDNGMRYYLRANAKPEGKANFYIIHDIGALWEEHNQNGLAHFLEHMAFNGLKNFPGKSMLEYMQSIGCSFGRNINASTGQTLTQYLLTDVPIKRQGVIDTCLLILHDWSGHILCEKDELDNERGVIREEWRTGMSAGRRNQEAMLKVMFGGSRYATRTVIGDTSVINNFTQEDILDFYHKWYRPNLQAVVIIGDFSKKEMDKLEQQVKTVFGVLKNPENPVQKDIITINDNSEPIIDDYTDPELTNTSLTMYIKRAGTPKAERNSINYLEGSLKQSLVNHMLSMRVTERRQKENAPFSSGFMGLTGFVDGIDAFAMQVSTKNGALLPGFTEMLSISEQARRFGFTQNELDLAKKNLLAQHESGFDQRKSRDHGEYYWSANSNFLGNYALTSEEFDLELCKKVCESVTLDELNQMVKDYINIGKNTLIFYSGPESKTEVLPTNEQVRIAMYGAAKMDVKPYVSTKLDQPLLTQSPKAGTIKSISTNKIFKTTELTLSNGIRVIVKPTTFKDDEVIVMAYSDGGWSQVDDASLAAAKQAMNWCSGYGNYNATQLRQYLSGKKISVYPSFSEYSQGLVGFGSPKDISTILELMSARFIQPNYDVDDFKSSQARTIEALRNRMKNPDVVFSLEAERFIKGDHPRHQIVNPSDLEKVTLEDIQRINQYLTNGAGYTFFIVGNVDINTLTPMVEQYLASIPTGKAAKSVDHNVRAPKGSVKKNIEQEMEVAKASIKVVYTGEMKKTLDNHTAFTMLQRILRLRYTEEIREKRGGTYGASVYGNISSVPVPQYSMTIQFTTDPKMQEELTNVVYDELRKIAENGPLKEDFDKTTSNMKNEYETNLKSNNYWLDMISTFYTDDVNLYSNYERLIKSITPKEIQKMAATILKGNVAEVSMTPKK